MKDKREKTDAFAFRLSREKIKAFRACSAEEKLNWLEEANRFVAEFVPEDKRRKWKKFLDKRR